MRACIVPFCKSKGNIEGVSFHRFTKNHFDNWAKCLARRPSEISANSYICSKHFNDDDFILKRGVKTIKDGRLPVLNMPNIGNIKYVEETVKHSKRKLEMDPGPSTSQKSYDSDPLIELADLEAINTPVQKSSSSDSVGLHGSAKKSRRDVRAFHTYNISPRKIKTKLEGEKLRYSVLQNRYRVIQQHEKRLKIKVKHLMDVISHLKKKQLLENDAAKVLEKTFSGVPLYLMKRMLANTKNSKLSRKKYPEVLRSFAMTLQFYNSKAYEYVRKIFNLALPSQQTIRSWYSNIHCEPGFSEPAFLTLKQKVTENAKTGKTTICSFMLDEMSIKKQVDISQNKTWGYIDIGTGIVDDSMQAASEALVFMVVSLNDNWKLPIAYFFIKSLSAAEKANMVKEALTRLHDVGVVVTSITSDGPAVNFSMMSELGADVKQLDTTYFLHPVDKKKIFVMFDVCHMMKILRNNWAVLGKFVDPSGNVVDFGYIKKLHELQESEGLRFGNKLAKRHLEWQKQKMKVNLAVQTISLSVANAIKFLMTDIKHPLFQEAYPTISFIKLMDKVFDLLNSRNPFSKGYKTPINCKNEIIWEPIFNEAINYLLACKTINGQLLIHTPKKTPFRGFIISIKSTIGIYEEYVKNDNSPLKYLLTYKLSQDHLELFFCSIRSKNGWNNNPSALQFYHTYRRLLLHHDIKNMNGNCSVQDATNILFTTKVNATNVPLDVNDINTIKKYGLDVQADTVNDHDYILPIKPSLSHLTENVVVYVAGYVVKMAKKIIKCRTCLSALEDISEASRDDTTYSLLYAKKFGALIVPSRDVTLVCKEVERNLRKVFIITDNRIPSDLNFVNTLAQQVSFFINSEKKIFNSLLSHIEDVSLFEENHVSKLTKTICLCYLKIRLLNFAKKQSLELRGDPIRTQLNKLILFKNQ